MDHVMQQLHEDHANLAKLLDALERQISTLGEPISTDDGLIQAALEYCLDYPHLVHHPKEDLVFRRLQVRDPAKAAEIGDLLKEHEKLSQTARAFATAKRQSSPDDETSVAWTRTAARNFIAAYRRHMEMEDTLFFPAAEAALSVEDWSAIHKEMDAELSASQGDPLFGANLEKRFEALRDYILTLDRIGRRRS